MQYARGLSEIECEFLRKHRKHKDRKKLFWFHFSIKKLPTRIHFWCCSNSFWSAPVKSSSIQMGATLSSLVLPLYRSLPARYFLNPSYSQIPHGVRFPKRSRPFLYRVFIKYFVFSKIFLVSPRCKCVYTMEGQTPAELAEFRKITTF